MKLRRTYKRIQSIISIGVMLLMLNSCFVNDPAFTRDNIDGYWILDSYDNVPVDPSEVEVFQFNGSGLDRYRFKSSPEGEIVWGADDLKFKVSCCTVDIYGEIDGLEGYYDKVDFKMLWDVLNHTDSLLLVKINTLRIDNIIEENPQNELIKMKRVDPDTESLMGLWQIESINGSPSSEFRVEVTSNSTYRCYKLNDGEWEPVEDKEEEYAYYGKFLAIASRGFYVNMQVTEAEGQESKCLELTSEDLVLNFIYIVEEQEPEESV